ncbi:glycerophosphoryl diester phosphodiesterase membrane domain-containing protein [Streptomyces acidiscabies]|uniref:Glycerophosphoryl diester phosphodiesterase membrane domain-containing protein n=3 Tax=Streptomyces acidiscabies TaxID=42234 RepID=A0AAP6EDW9_9ACTN|nr:glycerophosphoryl diester phosphodiesterase membrane domain-containing protein [Streptomyces acidiscabies]MBZ3910371.1 glycerophosphoryl diester phosphodiesterase membrane domain-containing protein [Streptomyces acidiscabies]MDX2959372.1 glycerophosphoryl diester phosphodiesterase membrane domain-containing protein [Streptomyces acidiscabies]MDX3019340.1 glycerophosphoryl diester phosphodiesterase membrane domain-containing protein [Streptomyces acidiscabies]MDX3790579.1 glycerophosphoryl di
MNDTPGWASPGSAPEGPEGQESTPPSDQQGGRPSDSGTQWSEKQPPAGQWTAPTRQTPGQTPPPPPPGPGAPTGWNAPTTHPGGTYGTPGGWGTGWGGPPPAAKPGIIPLRPLGVGEILDGAVSTMRTYWRTVLGISLAVAVVVEIITVLVQGLLLDDASTDAIGDPNASFDEVSRALGDSMTASAVVYAVSLIGTVIATALLTTVVSRAILGRAVSPGEAWRDALPRLPRLFALILLMMVLVVGTMVVGALPGILLAAAGGATAAGVALALVGVFAGLAVAIWLGVRFSLAPPALMLEKQGIKKALGRSVKLVRGSWWRVFGIQLLGTIISNILAMIVVVPFALVGAAFGGDGLNGFTDPAVTYGWTYLIISGIGAVIGYMITFPITAGVSVLLYVDQRIRREALDLELARAAGLQDYGTTATPGS